MLAANDLTANSCNGSSSSQANGVASATTAARDFTGLAQKDSLGGVAGVGVEEARSCTASCSANEANLLIATNGTTTSSSRSGVADSGVDQGGSDQRAPTARDSASASAHVSNRYEGREHGARPLTLSVAPAAGDRSNAVSAVLLAMAAKAVASQPLEVAQLLQVHELRRILEKPELRRLVDAYHQLEKAREAAPAGLEPFLADDGLRRIRSETLSLARITASQQEQQEDVEAGVDPDDLDQVEAKVLLEELALILCKVHIVSAMETFDEIEQQRQEAEAPKPLSPLPQSPTIGSSAERPLKQVGIRRNPNEKLGIVLKLENDEVVVSRILVGLGADRQGLLHVGDIMVEVDGVPCTGNLEAAEEQIRKAEGSFTVKLVPAAVDAQEQAALFYRALFDYDPAADKEHPYQAGGLAFKIGDVLEVVNAKDNSWWQARVVGGETRKTGLIPAKPMQERRLATRRNQQNGDGHVGCLGMRKSKPKTVMYSSANNADFDRHEIITYEEVAKVGPSQRSVVALIGAQGVGRRGLKYRLIAADKDKYATTLPTTSRARREEEEDGVQYYFTDNESMARDVKSPAYLESGEYNGCLYGTKTNSVRDVIKEGKVCLLDVNPNALKRLRNSEFKPFVIFIKAPDFETLKSMHQEASAAHNQEQANAYTDQDLQRTLNESEHIEKLYGHMFDAVIVNDNIEQAYHHLLEAIQTLDSQEQWVPACWAV